MHTTTNLKRLAFIGLACFTCVAVVAFARIGADGHLDSDSQITIEPSLVSEDFPKTDDPVENEFSFASRIPAVDNVTRAYPVQLAAFDSVPWVSQSVTPNVVKADEDTIPSKPMQVKDEESVPWVSQSVIPNRISSSIGKPADQKPDREEIARLPRTPAEPDTLDLVDTPPNWTRAAATAIQITEPVSKKPNTNAQNVFQYNRPGIYGLKKSPTDSKNANASQFQTNEFLANPGHSTRAVPNFSWSNEQQSAPSGPGNQFDGNYPLQQSQTRKLEAIPTVQCPEYSTKSNHQLAVFSYPLHLSNSNTNQIIANVETSTDSQPRPILAESNEAKFSASHAPTQQAVLASKNARGKKYDDILLAVSKFERPVRLANEESVILDQAIPNSLLDNPKPVVENNPDVAEGNNSAQRSPKLTTPDSTVENGVSNPKSKSATKTDIQDKMPGALRGAGDYVLAAEPKIGEHWNDQRPVTDQRAFLIDPLKDDFSPDPRPGDLPYDPYQEMQVYEGKQLYATQRPLVELGRPWYQLGQLSPGYSWLGKHNNVTPQFLIYGDARTAIGSSTQAGNNVSELAFEVNIDIDLKLTSTERFHMFMSPLDNGARNTRWLLDDNELVELYDANIDFGYFEGDVGAIVGGFINKTLPFDLPVAMGVMPLVLQNGVWMEDAFLGVAATIPARNSPKFNISNMDVTFFAGYDKINSDAFVNDDSAARMYGIASFIDAMSGYFELDYAFLEDRTMNDRSYHNIGIGFTRRIGRLLSHSSRVIFNAGQSTDVVENSADGVLLLSENSLITSAPSTVVPYLNLFAGFDRPQSAARAVQAGGILRNTGILFENDGMTNYPTLDPTANDTYGGALGLNLLAKDLSQQLIVEMAALGVMGESAYRNAPGGQYGVGFRYQLPLTNALIFRTDGMYGFMENSQDVRGLRFELRRKF